MNTIIAMILLLSTYLTPVEIGSVITMLEEQRDLVRVEQVVEKPTFQLLINEKPAVSDECKLEVRKYFGQPSRVESIDAKLKDMGCPGVDIIVPTL
jgi:hypothetical protein